MEGGGTPGEKLHSKRDYERPPVGQLSQLRMEGMTNKPAPSYFKLLQVIAFFCLLRVLATKPQYANGILIH